MPPSDANRTVLVAEDEPLCLEAISAVLQFAGYQVATATDGLRAMEYLQRGAIPSLILLDLMMPIMDGWQFIAELRHHPEWASIPIVLISGEARLAADAARLNVAGYLEKPFDVERLLSIVKKSLSPGRGADLIRG